jgi:DNA-binding transcriptional LysR family regulator
MPFDARVLSGIGVLAAVVEARSFARAATALGLTQSGVSRAVARLEERVGVRLLQRSSRAVTLTDEGRRFYERVAPLLAGIEDAAGEAHETSRKPRGKLRICVDALVGRVLIGPTQPRSWPRTPTCRSRSSYALISAISSPRASTSRSDRASRCPPRSSRARSSRPAS